MTLGFVWEKLGNSVKHGWVLKMNWEDFPDGPVVKNLPANAEDTSSILDLQRSHML